MRLRNLLFGLILTAGSASATPSLQLDIFGPGTFYDDGSTSYVASPDGETVLSGSDTFTLYAYGNTTNGNGDPASLDLQHFISVAVVPKGTNTEFGSFDIAGNTYMASDLTFGTPPIEATSNPILGGHGVFETLFLEVGFYFDPQITRSDVNVQTSPGTDPTTNPGDAIAYVPFAVDTSGLLDGFELHFDLYNINVKKNGDITLGDFAPFSHDAGTSGDTPPFVRVPEPGTLAIFSLGLVLISGFLRGRKKH